MASARRNSGHSARASSTTGNPLDTDIITAQAAGPALLDRPVRAHAGATEQLLRNPESGSELAVRQAKRQFTLGKERKS